MVPSPPSDDWVVPGSCIASGRCPIAPAIAPAILAVGSGSYGVLYAVAGVCAIIGALAILPVKRVR